MFAQLGNIEFNNLMSFTDMSISHPSNLPQHRTIRGKPKIQKTNQELRELRLSVRLHAFYCHPQNELNKLIAFSDSSEILPLILGNGKVEGNFVITSLESIPETMLPDGNMISCIVSISLIEFHIENRIEIINASNNRNAPAVGNRKFIATTKQNTPTCPVRISKLISSMENQGNVLNTAINERGGIIFPENKSKAVTSVTAITANLHEISKPDDYTCTKEHPEIRIISQNTIPMCNACKEYVNSGNVVMATMEERNIRTQLSKLKLAAQPLISSAIVRR